MNKYFIILLIVFFTIECQKIKNKKPTEANNESPSFKKNSLKISDTILWKDSLTTIYYHKEEKKEWEEKELFIYTNKYDTIIKITNDNGASFNDPYFIEKDNEIFFIIFETWSGSGNHSKKKFFHLNKTTHKADLISITTTKKIVDQLKTKFNIRDSLYTKKGYIYREQPKGKHFFDKHGNLPFALITFNHSNSDLNKGLEGFRKLKGVYKFEEKNNEYFMTPENLTLEN
ncbi:hypothetical protein [Tenacibaculum ovolyticum]|uniref:hypothetical protein n=1 Tax=Tenacibaculum ovolyticum TaxID=104270 RepID=UPI003BAA00BE